ncbi:SURF1 family protein [Shimia abyssi]|uniref:SURF1-like protein n=1 Tax=Shimia abyssi TaxID=1662395 RepID=A0A2P8FD22_9RHOB|nr:SURF1 family protein [Shimia abyssi]PSL19620.1 surfeit locus 1 family protein [Shimia abyssi]
MARYLLPLFFGVLGTVVLVSLGVWQVQRMGEKEAYLSDISARIGAVAADLPAKPDPVSDRFLAVRAAGQFTGEELHVLASTRDVGAVYRIVAAFETSDGRRVMVDRGWIKPPQKDVTRPKVDAMIEGNLHWPNEVDSYTPQNDLAANIWFARDVSVMADALGAEPVLIVLRETSENDPTVTPLPVDTSGIANDHLEYIVTWFGLAIVWVAMTLYYLHRLRKSEKA